MKKLAIIGLFAVMVALLVNGYSCYKGPEDLPKFKKAFRTQIEKFEKQKEDTSEKMIENISELTDIEQALENAKNKDKEFKKIYNRWNGVEKEVNRLTKDYEGLRDDAQNLFDALDRQTNGLNNADRKAQLLKALTKVRTDYDKTLNKTEKSINKLQALYADAQDLVQALEVSVALGEFESFKNGMASIEAQVPALMDELNEVIKESKDLYEKKIGAI